MWQGPPHVNKVKQYKLCRPLRSVGLFSRENKEFIYYFVYIFLFRLTFIPQNISITDGGSAALLWPTRIQTEHTGIVDNDL